MCVCVFCCCCISRCPVHLEGYSRPLDRPGMLAKHFSGGVCVCHFEGGGNLTVIKVKRPTVLARGRGEKEGGEGRWIDRVWRVRAWRQKRETDEGRRGKRGAERGERRRDGWRGAEMTCRSEVPLRAVGVFASSHN